MSDLNREDFSKKEWGCIWKKRWNQTQRGKELYSIYYEKYRESYKLYQKSKVGKKVTKLYRQSVSGELTNKKYNQSTKGRKRSRIAGNKSRAKKLNANVSWANEESIKLIYAEAVRRTEETGTQYDVDHFIPLQGKNVSGLHVEGNLKVMLHTDNCSKQNIFTPEMEQSVILEMA